MVSERCGTWEESASALGSFLAHVRIFRPALPLGDTGGPAAPAAQIIKLGAPDPAAADDFHRIHQRAEDREYPFHPLAIGDLAYGEALVQPRARTGDAHPFEGLKALAGLILLGFLVISDVDHLDVDLQGVAGTEWGKLPAAPGRVHLFPFEGLDQVHFLPPSGGFRGEKPGLLADKERFS